MRETRKRFRLTQNEFALKLGVSLPTVNRWENGRTQPIPLAVMRITALLQEMREQGSDLIAKYFPENLSSLTQTYNEPTSKGRI